MAPRHFSAFELEPGAPYEVSTPFEDYDGGIHPAGESWRFLSHNYFPYDAGLTLYISSLGASRKKSSKAPPRSASRTTRNPKDPSSPPSANTSGGWNRYPCSESSPQSPLGRIEYRPLKE
jgi:hypothetical protein